jgi:hypothetical protein
MIHHFDIGSGQPIGQDDSVRDVLDRSDRPSAARLSTVDEAAAIERAALPAPAAVLTVPVDKLLARVGGTCHE